MRIDKAGHQGGVTEVYDFGAGRNDRSGSDGLDFVADDYYHARRDEPIRLAVKKARGAQNRSRLLCERSGAVLALPMLDAALAVLDEMATFEDAGVAGAVPESQSLSTL